MSGYLTPVRHTRTCLLLKVESFLAPIFDSLRPFIKALRDKGDLIEIDAPVSPELEIPEIHRRVIAAGGPALLFRNVKGYRFPLTCNLFGTKSRVDLAFGNRPKEFVERISTLPETMLPPSLATMWANKSIVKGALNIGFRNQRFGAPVKQVKMSVPDITQLPATKSWVEDGGRFITLPLVHTGYPKSASGNNHGKADNLGMYRIQFFGPQETGMHFQIGKGGGFHLAAAESLRQALPLNLYLGGPPALILSAIAPLPENVPELLLASLLMGKRLGRTKIPESPLKAISQAEFCITGEVRPGERRPEGPFGDHYGYYSLVHDYPVFHIKAIYHRKDAIFPATVVGKPRQEDFFLGDYLQELLLPLAKFAMPAVKDLWSYGETGFHSLTAARLQERYGRESLAGAFRILGEGQLSLTKFLLGISGQVELRDFKAVLTHILERVSWEDDLYIFGGTAYDSLDYASGTKNRGSKGLIVVGDTVKRRLSDALPELPSDLVQRAGSFVPGCLVVELTLAGKGASPGALQDLLKLPQLQNWPLIVVVDDLKRALLHTSAFLWTTFTRLDPALDIHSADKRIVGGRVSYHGPVLFDSRMKPWYPKELFCDPETAKTVSHRWNEYFPKGGVEMGPSEEVGL